jgi:hypothetical protein
MSRVFLLEKTDFDISDAKRYGDLEIMFHQRCSVFDHFVFQDTFLRELRHRKFDKRVDRFLFVGTSTPLVLVTSFLIVELEWVNVLLFHARTQTYVERTLGHAKLK